MYSKLIPATVMAALLATSGAVIATAQTTPSDGPTTAPAVDSPATDASPAERAGFFEGRSHDGGRGGHGGPHGGDIVRGILSQADADGDGSVTQVEIDTRRTALVGEADASGEGNLSLEEFEAVYAQLIRSQMVDAFQNLDEDGDASVTAAELDARLSGVVERMDRDGDGALSPADGRGGRGDRG